MTSDEAIKILKDKREEQDVYLSSGRHPQLYYALDMAIKALEQESQQKVGHWIFDKEKLGYWISTCSECEHIFHGNEVLIYKPKFCANCGAKMEVQNEDCD